MGRLVLTVEVVNGLPVVTDWEYPDTSQPDLEAQAAEMADFEAKRVVKPAPLVAFPGSEAHRLLAVSIMNAYGPRSYSHWGMFNE